LAEHFEIKHVPSNITCDSIEDFLRGLDAVLSGSSLSKRRRKGKRIVNKSQGTPEVEHINVLTSFVLKSIMYV
jgi:hypothetical protein